MNLQKYGHIFFKEDDIRQFKAEDAI